MANFDFENKYWWNGMEVVAGIDEAGRGSIAGPLVVGLVVFPPFYDNTEFNDSKMLTDRQRRKLLQKIKKDAVYYCTEIISIEEVDQYNIYKATQIGMERALKRMNTEAEAVLTDAMPLPHVKKPVEVIIKGDQKSCSIAAASIVAKVTRDDIMIELDKKFPGYGLASNKGYCTKKHVKALEELGIQEEIHRKTYEPVKSYIHHDEQITLDEYIEIEGETEN